ncbi:MAG: PAS domain S-box protein [Planctomycetes bacterium]|nr:PAS domain S-box protein [Planctomycetota bacterium]
MSGRDNNIDIDLVQNLVVCLDLKGNIDNINIMGAQQLGYEKEDLLGRNWFESFIPSKLRKEVEEVFRRTISGEDKSYEQYDNAISIKNGEERIFSWRNSLKRDENGDVLGVISSGSDVTEKRTLEKVLVKLRESDHRLRYTMNAANLGSYDVHFPSSKVKCNDTWYTQIGYEPQEFILTVPSWQNLLHSGDRDRVNQAFNDYLTMKSDIYSIEFRIKRKDGTYSWVYSRGEVMERDSQGVAVRMVGIHVDITAYKNIQLELERSSEALGVIVNSSHEGIAIHKEDIIVESNAQLSNMFGYDHNEFIGKSVFDLVAEESREVLIKHVTNGFNGPYIAMGKKKNHEKIYCEIRANEVYHRGEKMWVAAIRNITERIQFEERLKKEKLKAEQASATKSLFMANMSHELRTPMNGILGLVQLMQSSSVTDEQKKYLDIIYSSGQSLIKIMNDILDVEKIQSGNVALELNDFNMEDLVNDLKELMTSDSKAKGLELKVSYSINAPKVFRGDVHRLNQVLSNLLSNAIKFTDEGTVSLEFDIGDSRRGLTECIIKVKDTGVGIPLEKQACIFDRFSQADDSYTREYGGTGLGLSISKELVELMGGRIELHSTLGIGSTFTVKIPLKNPSNEEEVSNSELIDTSKMSGLNALIVEDSYTNQLVLSKILKSYGINSDIAEQGKEALEMISQNKYDLVFMDIQMPIMNGYEATREMRKKGYEIPIIGLSAAALTENREKCIAAGMNDFMAKPVLKDRLLKSIYQHVIAAKKQ